MFKTSRLLFAALTAALLPVATPALANGDYLTINVGQYEALRDNNFDTIQYGLEYRFSEWRYNLHPIIGAFGTGDSAAYVYAGLNWNLEILPQQLYIVPNFAIGAYHKGDGKNLGGTLEFRSGIEVDYQLQNAHQVGLALNHISNASIYDHNPGEESVLLTYSVPMSIFK